MPRPGSARPCQSPRLARSARDRAARPAARCGWQRSDPPSMRLGRRSSDTRRIVRLAAVDRARARRRRRRAAPTASCLPARRSCRARRCLACRARLPKSPTSAVRSRCWRRRSRSRAPGARWSDPASCACRPCRSACAAATAAPRTWPAPCTRAIAAAKSRAARPGSPRPASPPKR